MAKLIFLSSDFAGRAYDLVLEKTTVGRGDQNTLVIRDGSVSATHCEILTFGSEVILRDLGSANGTYVDGARLKGQTQIKSGQILRFGKVEARLDLGTLRDDSDASEMTAIHEHAKLMREQRKAKSTTPLMKLEHTGPVDNETQTVLTPLRPAPAPVPSPAATPEPKASGKGISITRAIAVTIVIILGAILFLWLLRLVK